MGLPANCSVNARRIAKWAIGPLLKGESGQRLKATYCPLIAHLLPTIARFWAFTGDLPLARRRPQGTNVQRGSFRAHEPTQPLSSP